MLNDESMGKKDVVLGLFKFIVNTSARNLIKKSINRGPKWFFSQTSWVEIQVAHSTANTSANIRLNV